MRTTDAQVKKLRAEMSKGATIGVAAARAGMHRNTASKYGSTNRLPSEMREVRGWRTREDPFEEDWPELAEQLRAEPSLDAKTLFGELLDGKPDKYRPGQLRTLQRRVKVWRAQEGPDKELFFPQAHRPGEAAQTDFTHASELEITIGGEPFPHLLCHLTLPYSNWSWATPCQSESMAALRKGVQEALFRLGRVPQFHQTDNSTAATHNLGKGKRAFNDEYVELMRHLGMKPRTTGVGKKEQNGDIEASNGALKRYLDQRLLVRGSREFDSKDDYVQWLTDALELRNRSRRERLDEELAVMRPLSVRRLPEFSEIDLRVGSSGTIRVKSATYSVPSRLKDEKVRVRVFDDRLEIYYAQKLQLEVERVHGKKKANINYRHIIESMLRKPGAFRLYRYRDALFPTAVFRKAFELLEEASEPRRADIEYLRILKLAATTMETSVEQALKTIIDQGKVPTLALVRAITAPKGPEVPELDLPEVDLASFDALLDSCRKVSA